MIEAALILGAYLVGAIPFGVLIARAKGVDIFKVGSGNIGATNVKRALGLSAALLVFALDILKGAIPTLTALIVTNSHEWALGAGIAAIAGHCLSPFLGFKGGKGISTALGVALASSWPVALSAFGVFCLILAITRYVSLSSLIAVPSALVFSWIYGEPHVLLIFYGVLTLFVLFRHRANISRLRNGTESKFEFKSKKEPAADEPEATMDKASKAYTPYSAPQGGQGA